MKRTEHVKVLKGCDSCIEESCPYLYSHDIQKKKKKKEKKKFLAAGISSWMSPFLFGGVGFEKWKKKKMAVSCSIDQMTPVLSAISHLMKSFLSKDCEFGKVESTFERGLFFWVVGGKLWRNSSDKIGSFAYLYKLYLL